MAKFTKEYLKKHIEPRLAVGAKVRLGPEYCKGRSFNAGEVITLVQGEFEHDNGLYTETQTAPSIWDAAQRDFDSIYHLFGNNLEYFLDCEIIDS